MTKIVSERLALRPLKESDLETTHKYASCPENSEFIEFLPNETLEDTATFLAWASSQWESDNQKAYEFAILLDDKHIGATSANIEDGGVVSIGWIVRKDHWGKGYATEAAKAVLSFAFDVLDAEKVIATCDYRNAASIKVMEKIGLTFENGDRLRSYKNGKKDVQELLYSIKRDNR
ncbi:MAG: GNAT family N-acetyltransferase [Defluviitaleaceae bacterium]|nr:GNAT family N-acetyltransferase [Defluviitaleaceae bacterium]